MAESTHFARDDMASLFGRQNGCVQCANMSPSCPNCPTGQECKITSLTCQDCPKSYCAVSATTTSTPAPTSSGPNIGAIVGGVIGGLAVIAVLTYLMWRFCVRNRRDYERESWQPESEHTKEGVENDFASRRSQRASTHTAHSIASTVLTRASNIIQIAYIPGVTNRANPTSPTVLVPPVPPIPLAHSENGSPSPYEEQHFFVPGNLRDSTYSGISGYTDRTSYAARSSYAPRSSVASTIYGKNAVVSPLPAQKGTLLKPSLVSVKSRAGPNTPPVPSIDFEKYDQPPPSPAFSIGSTFLKSASTTTATAVTIRPQVVRVGSGPKMVNTKPTVEDEEASGAESSRQTPTPHAGRDSAALTIIEDSPVADQGPFADPPASPQSPRSPPRSPPRRGQHSRNSSLSAVIEETTRRQAQARNQSPFGDENTIHE